MRLLFTNAARRVLAAASVCACAHMLASGAALAAPFDVLRARQDSLTMNGARALAVSPDGKHVYVAASLGSDIAGIAIGATGSIQPLGVVTDGEGGVDGLFGCVDVAVSPDGKHVYAAGAYDDAVAIFARNAATGALGFVDAVFDGDLPSGGLNGPTGVALSPDGAHVYVTAGVGDTLAVFARDADTGLLALVEVETNVPERFLEAPEDLVVSPDGALVYVVSLGLGADSLITFARDPASGALTQIDTEQDLVGGVTGLAAPMAVAASADGSHVYAAASYSHAITTFARSWANDSTSWVASIDDADPGVDGLLTASGVALTPDDAFVLVAGHDDDALAVFSRDAATGQLHFERAVRDDADAAYELLGPIDVAADPFGRFAYVVAYWDDSLTVFAPEPGAAASALAAVAALALRRGRAQRSINR